MNENKQVVTAGKLTVKEQGNKEKIFGSVDDVARTFVEALNFKDLSEVDVMFMSNEIFPALAVGPLSNLDWHNLMVELVRAALFMMEEPLIHDAWDDTPHFPGESLLEKLVRSMSRACLNPDALFWDDFIKTLNFYYNSPKGYPKDGSSDMPFAYLRGVYEEAVNSGFVRSIGSSLVFYDLDQEKAAQQELIYKLANEYWGAVENLQLPHDLLDRVLRNYVAESVVFKNERDEDQREGIDNSLCYAIVEWGATHGFVIDDPKEGI